MNKSEFKIPDPTETGISTKNEPLNQDIRSNLVYLYKIVNNGVPNAYKPSNRKKCVSLDRLDVAIEQANPNIQALYYDIKAELLSKQVLTPDNFVHSRIEYALNCAFYGDFDFIADKLELKTAYWVKVGQKISFVMALSFFIAAFFTTYRFFVPAAMFLYGVILLEVSTTKKFTLAYLFFMIYPLLIFSVLHLYKFK